MAISYVCPPSEWNFVCLAFSALKLSLLGTRGIAHPAAQAEIGSESALYPQLVKTGDVLPGVNTIASTGHPEMHQAHSTQS
jgi:hypothetical protein